MRLTLLFTILGISLASNVYSQNIKKLLTKEELRQFDSKRVIIKSINNESIDVWEGFTGSLLIRKNNNKFSSIEIGTWVRENSKYGNDAIMKYDSIGRLLDYKEINKHGIMDFDCVYSYDTINAKYYRLEKQFIYDNEGNPLIAGQRYWLVTKDNFGFYRVSRKKKYGLWKYFDEQGKITKTKEYGVIK